MIFIFTFFGFKLIKCSQLGQYCTKNDFVIKMTFFHPSDEIKRVVDFPCQ